MSDKRIVVGVEASHSSEVAVDWAADEARSRGVQLRIVSVYDWPLTAPWEVSLGIEPQELTDLRADSERLVATLAARARGRVPGLGVETASVRGDPVDVLESESRTSALVVVGSRHLHSLSMRFLGSVAAGLAPRTHCPMVVLRGPAGDPAELAWSTCRPRNTFSWSDDAGT